MWPDVAKERSAQPWSLSLAGLWALLAQHLQVAACHARYYPSARAVRCLV